MTYWTDCSTYIRNQDDLRLLAELIRIHCGSAIGQQIYPIVTENPAEVRAPFTFNHNKRLGILAILISLIESANVPAIGQEETKIQPGGLAYMYPNSIKMASRIADRERSVGKLTAPNSIKMASRIADRERSVGKLTAPATELSWMLNIVLLAWFRQNKQNNRAVLPTEVRSRIQLFSETIIRAGQIYRETLFRNKVLWDSSESGFVGNVFASEFNFAFNISYIELAISDLAVNSVHTFKNTSGSMYHDLPELISDA